MNKVFPRRIYVLPRPRIVWVPIAKNGFTSILHILAEVNGNRSWLPEASGFPEWSAEALIHDPKIHGLTWLESLGVRDRMAALTDPGWWRFAVVRAPHARFLSAWVDKVFLQAPGTPHLWQGAEDVLTHEGNIDVTATFQRFVVAFQRSPERYLCDQHFALQHVLLSHAPLQGLEIIPLSELPRVQRRLEELGHNLECPPRLNESLKLDHSRVYDELSYSAVAEIYAGDLKFDSTGEIEQLTYGEPLILTKLETDCVRKLRAASERIRQLSRLAVLPRLTVWLQRVLGIR
jgi:hypothetical protein